MDRDRRSPGQSLGTASGIAYSLKYIEEKKQSRVWCIMKQSECAQGSIWQAASFSSFYKLNNIAVILNCSTSFDRRESQKLSQQVLKARWESFGYSVHTLQQMSKTELKKAMSSIVQEQMNPVAFIIGEDFCQQEFYSTIIKDPESITLYKQPQFKEIAKVNPSYKRDQLVSTCRAYGNALLSIVRSKSGIMSLDGDVNNQTFSAVLKQQKPQAFIQCFIAEQNMVDVAAGLARRGSIPFVSTFAACLQRAAHQIMNLGVLQSNVKFMGSHSGVNIGQDGPTQMALQDIAFFRSIPYINIYYPSDGVSCQRAVQLAANHAGLDYIRATMTPTPVIYDSDQSFKIGQIKIVRQSNTDQIVLLGAGCTLHQCLRAAEKMFEIAYVRARVVDLFCLKPFDQKGMLQAARSGGNRVLVVQQHYKEGGIFQLVAASLVNQGVYVQGLCVLNIPCSASSFQQLAIHGLDIDSIIGKALDMLKLL